MPPQVNPAGSGSKPTAIQTDNQVETEKKNAQPQKESSIVNTTTPHRATPEEASARKAELAAGGVSQQTALNGKLNASQIASEKASATTSRISGRIWDSVKHVIPETTAAAPGVLKAAEVAREIKELDDEIKKLEREIKIDDLGKKLLEYEAKKRQKQIEEKMRDLE